MSRWLPLESNPAVMNKFLVDIGVPSEWSVADVYGLEFDMLKMVPKPVVAVLLLYPLTDKSEEFKSQQELGIEAAGQDISEQLYFMKQYVGNACGTVALLHATANNLNRIDLSSGALKDFLDKTQGMSPEDRGHALEDASSISQSHDSSAQEGQTEAPDRETKLDTHFIALVQVDGTLYELDGRKKFPINHGSTSDDTFLVDCANVCRSFMDLNPEDPRYAVTALTATPAE